MPGKTSKKKVGTKRQSRDVCASKQDTSCARSRYKKKTNGGAECLECGVVIGEVDCEAIERIIHS